MKIPIVCTSAQVTVNTTGLFKVTEHVKVIADMSDEQIKELFFEIWSKVGNDELEKWLGFEGFELTNII